jgi:WD40 repeat protein
MPVPFPSDLTLRLWDLTDGKEIRRFPMREGGVTSLAFSENRRYILAAGLDGDVVLSDVATGNEINRLKGHAGPVRAVAISADGRHALTGGDDKTVRTWKVPK